MIIQTLDRATRRIMDGVDRRLAILELARMQGWRLADLGIERGRIPEIVDGLIARRNAARAASRAPLPPDTGTGAFAGGPVSGAAA